MSRTDSSASAHLIAAVRVTPRVALTWLVASVAGFFAFAYCFGSLFAMLDGRSLEPITITTVSVTGLSVRFVAVLVLVAVVIVGHELLHGVFIARYGGDPGYGIGVSQFVFPYAYATTDRSYARTELIVILLAPFVVITALGLATALVYSSSLVVVALAVNAAGSIGDLWMAAVLLQYPPDVRVAALPDDRGGGFGVYASSDGAVARRPGTVLLARVCAGTVGSFAILLTGGLVAVFGSLAVGSGTVVVGDPGSYWFLFSHERLAGGGAALEVGTPLVAGLTIAGGVGWALVSAIRRPLE